MINNDISILLQTGSSISYKDDMLQSVSVYGIIESQMTIQPLSFDQGRYFSTSEFTAGTNVFQKETDVKEAPTTEVIAALQITTPKNL